jgi:hypothetical protein
VPRYVLNYRLHQVIPSDAFPVRKNTPRPYLALNLINNNRAFRCYGLVDSGADDCIFPASFARQLGLDYQAGKHYQFGGAGEGDQSAYFFDLGLEIVGIIKYSIPIGFSPIMDKFGAGVLGQNGFFDHLSLGFHLPRGVFAIYTP